ncbi:MAG TPA: S8 family serine peptidase, partial [Rhodospirillales bacterium]|nr:S8 family serine peptidase [Rhodospirillales bacterium]
DIYSTWYATGSGASTYFSRSGTSQAAPHVAGVAALVWARWPAWTPEQVMRQLIATAVDVEAPGWDVATGWGRIDAAAAVSAANSPADLVISVGALPDPVIVGNPLTTTIVISNAGPGLATSITLTATLPAGGAENALATGGLSCTGAGSVLACGAGSLAAGATAAITVVAAPQTVGDGKLRTRVAVTGAQIDPHPADNAAVWVTAVLPMLSGWVFLDVNRDGQRQDWETGGVAGAWLTLEQGGRPVAQVLSAAPDGGYHFDVVATGVYSLAVSLPDGYQATSPTTLTVIADAGSAPIVNFGARSPGPDPTATLTPTVTATRTVTPTPSSTPTQTATVAPSAEPTQTPTSQSARRLYLPVVLSD